MLPSILRTTGLLLCLPFLAAAIEPAIDGTETTIPEGPAARAAAAISETTSPAKQAATSVLGNADAWMQLETWQLWSDTLLAERDATPDDRDPARNALLARLAAIQGRDSAAWRHYSTLVASPEHAASTLPYLFPGIPAELNAAPGGVPPALPNGCALRPSLPPQPEGRGPLAYREATCTSLQIGDALIDLKMTVESTGVQLDLTHISGAAATIEVLLPEPAGFDIRVEYVDWMRQDDRHAPRLVELLPGTETISIFGRVLDRPLTRPAFSRGTLPAQLKLGGLVLELEPGSEAADTPMLRGICSLLANLLGIDVRLTTGPEPQAALKKPAPAGFPGTRIRLSADPNERALTLRYLVDQIEASLLTQE
ncbi:MAG: hypothetical protein ACI841_005231 [Planctomycetota bacterium]|jgi:hypothetical protein